jgi:hypothetical protein
MECSHGDHFSEVSNFFKLNQYLTDSLVNHKPRSYGFLSIPSLFLGLNKMN